MYNFPYLPGEDAHFVSQIIGKTCKVKGFHYPYVSIDHVLYVDVVYKYRSLEGQDYFLELNQALDFTNSMKHSISCTNQDRHNSLLINDTPRIIDRNCPQCITFPNSETHIPLYKKGPAPVLVPASKPSPSDLHNQPRLQLTSNKIPCDATTIFGNNFALYHPYDEWDDEYSISVIM